VNGDPEQWVRINIELAADDQSTYGKPTGARFEMLGDVIVECFSPSGLGPGQIENLVDDVRTALRNESTSTIDIYDMRSVPVFLVDDIYLKSVVEASWRQFDG
jgi:hypothetical protein